LVNLTALIAFWRKKEASSAPVSERIIPLPTLPEPPAEIQRSTSQEAVDRARETLKIFKLERQILGSAITTIYDSQTKGLISQAERDQMLEKYKVDVKRLEKAIEENQRVVDLSDVEIARNELVRNFNAQLSEIDARLRDLRSGSPSAPTQQRQEKKSDHSEKSNNSDEKDQKQVREKKSSDEEDQQITDAEKRVEKIREEILKAMDRLEQIEAEG
jgi:hypothetical protein